MSEATIALVLGDGSAAAQREFHSAAGFEVVPPERADEARERRAEWLVHAEPGEYWSPRGATAPELLASVPPRFGVVYGVRSTVDGVELRPVVRISRADGNPASLRGWYPFDVLSEPTAATPAPRRSLDEEVALAVALEQPTPTERERLDAIEARLTGVEVSVVAKLRWKLTYGRRAR
jgi:hypothetical protein